MRETEQDLEELQALLDRSHARLSTGHMRAIVTAEHRLDAGQLARHLQGTRHVTLATVTAAGEPRVRPLDALFVHGRFHLGTAREALTARHLARRPAVSLSYLEGETIGVVAHGTAVSLARESPEARELDDVWTGIYGQ